ncbi:MAG TPA: hypothetical protein VMJ70_11860 [Candidatus Sulfotelmatobacter sp.]|nr:hypothetical protein [Candidatus Sulfotelmatobacter sp.]
MLQDLDNDSKPWDAVHRQLFHRINSDDFDKDRAPASGDGRKAGARSLKDFKEDGLTDLLANGVLVAVENALTGFLPALVTNLLKQFSNAAGDALQKKIDEINDAIAKLIASSLEGLVFGKFIRSIPAWVPVERQLTPVPEDEKDDKKLKAAVDKNAKERVDFEKTAKENEVEGRLTGSYQLPRGIPFLQWNRWFNWAFDVKPIDGYRFMVGKGNVRDEPEDDALNPPTGDDTLSPATDVNEGPDQAMQCLMDFGAFSKTPGEIGDKLFASGPMFQSGWPFWPSCGDTFWATGRWVYDGTHQKPDDRDKDKELMPTQLHPLKAFASARYEGFKFDENQRPVAAVRFLFFATKRGGYLNLGAQGQDVADDECGVKINSRDYEFILDLPESPPIEDIRWPIGHSPVTDANTLVLRPSLLIDVKFAPFDVDAGTFADNLQFDQAVIPSVRLLKPPDPKKPTQQQVKVTIPLTKFDAGKDAYGVCISLGWADPSGELADQVKRIEMRFDDIKYFDGHSDVRLNFAANGRWVHKGLGKVPGGTAIDISTPGFLLFVPDDGIVQMECHSTRFNGFGRFEEEDNDADRTLHVGGIFRTPEELRKLLENAKKQGVDKIITDGLGKISTDFLGNLSQQAIDLLAGKREVVDWKKHVDQPDSDIASAVAREMFAKLPPLFNDQNEPLGMVEPSPNPLSVRGPIGDNSPGENPVLMRDLVKKVEASSPQKFGFKFDSVPKLEAIGDADKLAFHDSRAGTSVFELRVELNVSKQPDPS